MQDQTGRRRGTILKVLLYFFAMIGLVTTVNWVKITVFGQKAPAPSGATQNADLESSRPSFLQSLPKLKNNFSYSFFADDDKDGLSNAKEIIYGSDPYLKSTAGDNISDGEKVVKNCDPLKEGCVALSDRLIRNYSIEYFSWASNVSKNNDPQIDQALVERFYKEKLAEKLELLSPDTADITIDPKQTVAGYFNAVAQVKIPTPEQNYTDIIKDPERIDFNNLKELIARFTLTYEDLRAIRVASKATEYHKKMLTIVKNMISIFQDVSSFYLDPVKIQLNNYKFYSLIKLGFESEVLKKELLKQQ